MSTIALIGLRGSGKTAVGKELARQIGGSFIDTDDLITQAAGKTVADIFAAQGEAAFRHLEREAVARAVSEHPAVLSLGGGAILDPSNAAAIRSIASIIWLTAPPEVLVARIQSDPGTPTSRPRLTGSTPLEEVRRLLRDRSPVYQQMADHVIDTSKLGIEDVAHTIIEWLESRNDQSDRPGEAHSRHPRHGEAQAT